MLPSLFINTQKPRLEQYQEIYAQIRQLMKYQ